MEHRILEPGYEAVFIDHKPLITCVTKRRRKVRRWIRVTSMAKSSSTTTPLTLGISSAPRARRLIPA
jgi:hypothetical protein